MDTRIADIEVSLRGEGGLGEGWEVSPGPEELKQEQNGHWLRLEVMADRQGSYGYGLLATRAHRQIWSPSCLVTFQEHTKNRKEGI